MLKTRVKTLTKLFHSYKQNKKELLSDFNIPVPSGVRYDKIAVKSSGNNSVENMTVEYAARREELSKKVFIVDEVLNWFKLEGHGRERFIEYFLIDYHSWVSTEIECGVSRRTLAKWKYEVLEKAEMVAGWVKFF